MCELEFARVEDYSCSADENEVINGPPPMIQQLNIPVNGVDDCCSVDISHPSYIEEEQEEERLFGKINVH